MSVILCGKMDLCGHYLNFVYEWSKEKGRREGKTRKMHPLYSFSACLTAKGLAYLRKLRHKRTINMQTLLLLLAHSYWHISTAVSFKAVLGNTNITIVGLSFVTLQRGEPRVNIC